MDADKTQVNDLSPEAIEKCIDERISLLAREGGEYEVHNIDKPLPWHKRTVQFVCKKLGLQSKTNLKDRTNKIEN